MKQAVGLLLAVALVLLLGACKRSEVTQMGTALDDWANPTQSKTPQKVDVAAYQDADFSDALGIEIVSLPPVSSMSANKFFVLDEWFGQVEFTTEANLSLNVRLAKADGKRLSGTYNESHIFEKETTTIDGLEVSIAKAKEGCALVSWVRGDVQYVLHSNKKQGVPPMEDIELMVTWLDSVLVSGAAPS